MKGLTSFAAWNAKKDQYPFQLQTDGIKGSPRPEAVPVELYGDFIRVPIPEIDVVWWGFLTREAADRFGANFTVDHFDARGMA